jgi:hypothetical protein
LELILLLSLLRRRERPVKISRFEESLSCVFLFYFYLFLFYSKRM